MIHFFLISSTRFFSISVETFFLDAQEKKIYETRNIVDMYIRNYTSFAKKLLVIKNILY